MNKHTGITGEMKYGRLTFLEVVEKCNEMARWKCVCDCGTVKIFYAKHVKKGSSKSCGCLTITHGLTRNGKSSTELNVYGGMKARCLNHNHIAFKSYGGRGIKICDRWLGSFLNFYEDMGLRPNGKSLDRKDNNGDYTPENCKWSTPTEQQNNTRRNKIIEFEGECLSKAQWAKKLQMPESTFRLWLDKHGIETAITRGLALHKPILCPGHVPEPLTDSLHDGYRP
jgi:hypothetical protein